MDDVLKFTLIGKKSSFKKYRKVKSQLHKKGIRIVHVSFCIEKKNFETLIKVKIDIHKLDSLLSCKGLRKC